MQRTAGASKPQRAISQAPEKTGRWITTRCPSGRLSFGRRRLGIAPGGGGSLFGWCRANGRGAGEGTRTPVAAPAGARYGGRVSDDWLRGSTRAAPQGAGFDPEIRVLGAKAPTPRGPPRRATTYPNQRQGSLARGGSPPVTAFPRSRHQWQCGQRASAAYSLLGASPAASETRVSTRHFMFALVVRRPSSNGKR